MKVKRRKIEYVCVNEGWYSATVRLQGKYVPEVDDKYMGSTVR